MTYFVSYELLPRTSEAGPGKPGQVVITNSAPSEVMTDLCAILNDNGGEDNYALRVLALTVLPEPIRE